MKDIVRCQRCGDPCRASAGTPSARPFRKAARGFCAPCVIVLFFRDPHVERGVGFALPSDFDPEHLRLPHLQAQLGRVLTVGGSDLSKKDIDWDKVIEKWTL